MNKNGGRNIQMLQSDSCMSWKCVQYNCTMFILAVTMREGPREQGAEGNIWSLEGGSGGRMEKTA